MTRKHPRSRPSKKIRTGTPAARSGRSTAPFAKQSTTRRRRNCLSEMLPLTAIIGCLLLFLCHPPAFLLPCPQRPPPLFFHGIPDQGIPPSCGICSRFSSIRHQIGNAKTGQPCQMYQQKKPSKGQAQNAKSGAQKQYYVFRQPEGFGKLFIWNRKGAKSCHCHHNHHNRACQVCAHCCLPHNETAHNSNGISGSSRHPHPCFS